MFHRAAFAQDTPSPPSDLPAPPAEAAPPGVQPVPTPPVDAPPARVDATPPVAAPPATPPVAAPPATPPAGSAAFAPLPETPRPQASPKPRPVEHAAPPAAAAAPPPPMADEASQPSAAPATVHHQEEPEKDNDSDGVFGPFRIGVLVGGGLPELVSLGGQIKLTRFFGAGINVGIIPTVKISYYGDAKISYQEYDAYGRLYPFGGAFFLGAGVGYATIKGTLNSSLDTGSAHATYPEIPNPILVDSQGSVRTLVLTPQIGFMKIFGSGFAIGFDVGAQLPIAPSKVDFATNTPNLNEPAKSYVQATYIKPNDDKVRSTLDTIGRTPLPTFNLKIGWFL
ncbi:MAG: hypothetical protein ABW061_05450 [Polyangiaceae bacterium]